MVGSNPHPHLSDETSSLVKLPSGFHSTKSDAAPDSPAKRVFNMRECVDVIVRYVSHQTPFGSGGGAPATGWLKNMRRLLTVNVHFFASITQDLWSYIPSCDIITVIPTELRYRDWQDMFTGMQNE